MQTSMQRFAIFSRKEGKVGMRARSGYISMMKMLMQFSVPVYHKCVLKTGSPGPIRLMGNTQ